MWKIYTAENLQNLSFRFRLFWVQRAAFTRNHVKVSLKVKNGFWRRVTWDEIFKVPDSSTERPKKFFATSKLLGYFCFLTTIFLGDSMRSRNKMIFRLYFRTARSISARGWLRFAFQRRRNLLHHFRQNLCWRALEQLRMERLRIDWIAWHKNLSKCNRPPNAFWRWDTCSDAVKFAPKRLVPPTSDRRSFHAVQKTSFSSSDLPRRALVQETEPPFLPKCPFI